MDFADNQPHACSLQAVCTQTTHPWGIASAVNAMADLFQMVLTFHLVVGLQQKQAASFDEIHNQNDDANLQGCKADDRSFVDLRLGTPLRLKLDAVGYAFDTSSSSHRPLLALR